MWQLKACTVCFKTDGKLCKLTGDILEKQFLLVSGLKADDRTGCPQYLCVECSAYVRKYSKFRDKCARAHFALKEMLFKNNEVTKFNLMGIDTCAIGNKSALDFLNLKNVNYKEVQFQWTKKNRLSTVVNDYISVFHCNISLHKDFDDNVTVPRDQKGAIKQEVESTHMMEIDLSKALDNTSENDADLSKLRSLLEDSTQSTNFNDSNALFHDNDMDFDYDGGEDDTEVKNENSRPDGSHINDEFALMVPITMKEAQAAKQIMKVFGPRVGDYVCNVCDRAFRCKKQYDAHMRMHDMHTSGTFYCSICQYFYKTKFLLKTHMTDKHMYKYLCRKCPEVYFDKPSAKKHYTQAHMSKATDQKEEVPRPSWLYNRGGKRTKGVCTPRAVRKSGKLPSDFLIYTPVTHEQQYEIVLERKKSANYLHAEFKCELCYKGFRETQTYENHMKKHKQELSGDFQCDICKLFFVNTRKMYKHMIITHLFKYTCQMCNYVCYNKGQAHTHYKWHKNVTYKCPHCEKEFKKASTQLTHIRLKHPSTFICNICGHGYVSETGLYFHKKLAHTAEEINASESQPVDTTDSLYCAECDVQFVTMDAYKTHLGSSIKHTSTNTSGKPSRAGKNLRRDKRTGLATGRPRGRPRHGSSDIVNTGIPVSTNCELCNAFLSNDVQARKHYEAEHPGHELLKRYMCDVCGHTTRQYANLLVHMRTHTNEKPYECPHCSRRFSMPSNRDRHLVVHTGEKRYQCHHCNRRFTQSSAVKLHIQTVHLKIPYAPWHKKNRKRRKELEGAAPPPPPPKLLLDSHGDYLNAYITYNE